MWTTLHCTSLGRGPRCVAQTGAHQLATLLVTVFLVLILLPFSFPIILYSNHIFLFSFRFEKKKSISGARCACVIMVRGPIRYGMWYSATGPFVSTTALHLRRGFCTLVLFIHLIINDDYLKPLQWKVSISRVT